MLPPEEVALEAAGERQDRPDLTADRGEIDRMRVRIDRPDLEKLQHVLARTDRKSPKYGLDRERRLTVLQRVEQHGGEQLARTELLQFLTVDRQLSEAFPGAAQAR